MSDVTVENSIDGIADFKLKQDIGTPNTVVYFFHGTAPNEMLAKKSAKYVRKHYPTTVVKCFKGKFHCENALFNPEIMIAELDAIFNEQREEICQEIAQVNDIASQFQISKGDYLKAKQGIDNGEENYTDC